jgi:hypothetical protein
MAHSFDTGLAVPQRTAIRRGAVALLSGLLRKNGGYLSSVVPFGGVVRSYTDVEGLDALEKALNGALPGVAIALGDRISSPAGIGGPNHKGELEVFAYVASNHARDAVDGRFELDARAATSDSADPGLDVIMEHVEELLVGQRCGATATVKQVRPEREGELVTTPPLTIWLMEFRVTVTRSIDKYRSVEQLLESVRTRTTLSDEYPEAKLPLVPTKGSTLDTYRDDLAD